MGIGYCLANPEEWGYSAGGSQEAKDKSGKEDESGKTSPTATTSTSKSKESGKSSTELKLTPKAKAKSIIGTKIEFCGGRKVSTAWAEGDTVFVFCSRKPSDDCDTLGQMTVDEEIVERVCVPDGVEGD